jgi:anti-sigma regulatory factor (Ser/Thr protein kinase)
LSGDRAHEIYLAVEEAFVNICTHAYPRPNGHEHVEIRCRADEHNKSISITLIDSGRPFDPVSAPDPDTTSDISGRPVGGLGIHLIKEVTDELSYNREDEANRLTMTFKAR